MDELSFLRDAHAYSPRKGASFLRGALNFTQNEMTMLTCVWIRSTRPALMTLSKTQQLFLLQLSRPYPKDIIKNLKIWWGYHCIFIHEAYRV